ncbi:hypothetical protein HUT18_05735 [Streptomyces sp. NA04227]|uniref:hypothetical protein n=1 Tax=Streptomyces sp. NA04227 TaxID=2742136 RepID=UPI00158FB1F1|nr:hypothetical protein [Streptomyces sp. NA04227]QKW05970.1 hypothetical protein HUT18_05735 [Streptomyces sp. NA04227]
MAKNKRERKQPKSESQAERGQQEAQKSSMESLTHPQQSQGSPADVARKHQRRFGHN